MPSFELRFRRKPEDPVLSVGFDAGDAMEALMILPRNQGFDRGELWCGGKFLFGIARAENTHGCFWIVSPDSTIED